MKKIPSILPLLFISILLLHCSDSGTNSNDDNQPVVGLDILSDEVVLNPSGYAPLTATIEIRTEAPTKIDLFVKGKTEDGDLIQSFIEADSVHSVPVLGLYADFNNTVELTFYTENDVLLGTREYRIQTGPLIADMPEIEILVANKAAMDEGWTFVSQFGHREGGSVSPQQPFMFDSDGEIRWYLELADHPVLNNLFFDNGMERLFNGNLYFGDGSSNAIYEMDMLGNIVNSWPLTGYGFHHQVLEIPSGNFIFTANRWGIDTIEDHLVEVDRSSGENATIWDIRESLEYGRRAWDTNFGNIDVDWFHGNAVVYDRSDNTIIVSGRTQGTVKLTRDNEVVWVIGTHNEWGVNGRGEDMSQFLLQPLDRNNNPITDQDVLDGNSNHPDFEWSWYQHAPLVMPNGNIMLFDNGDNRNYTSNELYSRAVVYEIDEANMTIKQVWQYGKERGSELFSRIVSDVDYNPESRHVFFSPGAIQDDGNYGRVVEIDYDTKEVIFEAEIRSPQAGFGVITFHRTERMTIYPFSGATLQ